MTKSYNQFCPVSKAVEIVGERWTPLVLREMLLGATHFNDIRRGVPLMSPALLSKRLKDLEGAGVVRRISAPGKRATEYRLTEAGEDLKPIVVALGLWGHRWLEKKLGRNELDAGYLMWDMRRRIDPIAMPGAMQGGRQVVQFDYPDAAKAMRRWWLVVEGMEVDLCQSDPGYEVNLFISAGLAAMTQVWLGDRDLLRAVADDEIVLIGDGDIGDSIGKWLKLSAFAEAAKGMEGGMAC
ncbi:MAG: helix-turn-helix domain-containing protein [Alphaproteobacteria bacterium]|jgi:DNA-binding HxlR family transcriptional regulator|nr:helix-turn-helix domain-containing protein [Alphaproteobacteria bacterium]